ncbi:MAG: aminoacyl-tRNA deacylase [Polyangiaceae bacterium]
MKTNAVRILEKASIAFELRDYDVDPEDFERDYRRLEGRHSDRARFQDPGLSGGSQRSPLCVVPGNKEVCLKTLASASGERKCQVVPLKEVQPLTGYIRGGVTVLGAKKAFPVYVDATLLDFEQISVSAGTRGLQILLAPKDYVAVTAATVCEGLGRD